jgi:hypothetical protein
MGSFATSLHHPVLMQSTEEVMGGLMLSRHQRKLRFICIAAIAAVSAHCVLRLWSVSECSSFSVIWRTAL